MGRLYLIKPVDYEAIQSYNVRVRIMNDANGTGSACPTSDGKTASGKENLVIVILAIVILIPPFFLILLNFKPCVYVFCVCVLLYVCMCMCVCVCMCCVCICVCMCICVRA